MTLSQQQIDFFQTHGYLAIENLISPADVIDYRALYERFLDGSIDTGGNRSDLGAGLGNAAGKENITQIMWPSDFAPETLDMPYHRNAAAVARALLGEDMDMDFDMLIDKAPHSATPTPWHQDAAYWIDMPDKRAVSCWLALDEALPDNGCMWYVPGSHRSPLRAHRFAGAQGGALCCDADESEGVAIPLSPGSCVLHDGGTLHYSRGNTTALRRRAFIVNFRPAAMIAFERAQGFDHGRGGNAGDRKARR